MFFCWLFGKESEDVLLQEHPNIYLKLLLTYIAKELNKNCNSLLEEVGGKVWAISSIKNEISSYYINSLEVKTGFIGFRCKCDAELALEIIKEFREMFIDGK